MKRQYCCYIAFSFLVSLINSCEVQLPNQCCYDSTIKVTGSGTAYGFPDKVVIKLSFTEQGATSVEAVQTISHKVSQAVSILETSGLNSSFYEIGNLSVYPEEKYLSTETLIIGQQAYQTLTATITEIDSQGKKVGLVVNSLARVNGININQVNIDINDKTKIQSQALQIAFAQAKLKAEDYASFANLRVGEILKFEGSVRTIAPTFKFQNTVLDVTLMLPSAQVPLTQFPIGNISLSSSISITYRLE